MSRRNNNNNNSNNTDSESVVINNNCNMNEDANGIPPPLLEEDLELGNHHANEQPLQHNEKNNSNQRRQQHQHKHSNNNYGTSNENYLSDEDDEDEFDNNGSFDGFHDDFYDYDYHNIFDDVEEEEEDNGDESEDDELDRLLKKTKKTKMTTSVIRDRPGRQSLLAQIATTLIRNDDDDVHADTATTTSSSTIKGSLTTLSHLSNPQYDWKLFAPSPTKHFGEFLWWTMVGGSRYTEEQSDDELHAALQGLARCLQLLRDYLQHYGMPARGCYRDQEHVLREVIRDLYAGGAPLWALEPVMQKAAEGLTGQPNVNWQLFPRKAFIYNPASGTTSMFKMDRGFNIRKMSTMEGVAVRLASFASNAQGVNNIPARFPNPQEFQIAARKRTADSIRSHGIHPYNSSNNNNNNNSPTSPIPVLPPPMERIKMARKILSLASKQQGLFYYINSREYMQKERMHEPIPPEYMDSAKTQQRKTHTNGEKNGLHPRSNDDDNHKRQDELPQQQQQQQQHHGVEDFWIVSDEERELFSRLACMEALKAIDTIDARENDPNRPTIYTFTNMLIARGVAAASACAFWFGGSWIDMIVAGILAMVVAVIGTSSLLSKQERLVYEVVGSFTVGFISALLAMTWPNHMCFSAMAISGVIDLLQGFRVVFAIIEIMSRHTICGGADLLEGILFTGLITYFLQFGSYTASFILGNSHGAEFDACNNSVHGAWFFLLVPAATMSWSFMFTPNPRDLPGMVFHGLVGYCTNLALSKIGFASEPNYFISASVVSLSAGIFSRFTGRQAVGNTVTGLYTLLPGAYLVSALYIGPSSSYVTDILKIAVILGIGGWTGTILCSPTLLGTTRGLLWQSPTVAPNLRHSTSDAVYDNTRHQRPKPPPPPAARHVRRQSLPVHLELHSGDGNSNSSSISGMHRRASASAPHHRQYRPGHGRKLSFGGIPVPASSARHRRFCSMGAAGSGIGSAANHQRQRSRGKGSLSPHQNHPIHRQRQHHHHLGGNGDARGGRGHAREDSDASLFDFDQPTSTMLFF